MADINEALLTDIEHKKDYVIRVGTGDLNTIFGLANMKEALLRRLVTEKGAIIHRPGYGVGLKRFQNGPNRIDDRRKLAIEIREQYLLDSRVEEVRGVQVNSEDLTPQKVQIVVRVLVIGFGEVEIVKNLLNFAEGA